MDMEIQGRSLVCDWKATEKSRYFNSPLLYKENGFKEEKDARELIRLLLEEPTEDMTVDAVEKKKETKNPPLLYNLAELQNDCSKFFKISPDETLRIAQELYEKKMTTYPRTDARVLSSAVAKEIHKNIRGIQNYEVCSQLAAEVLSSNRIAVPGCHASGFTALIHPLVKAGLLSGDADLTCHSITGYSGGGKKMIA